MRGAAGLSVVGDEAAARLDATRSLVTLDCQRCATARPFPQPGCARALRSRSLREAALGELVGASVMMVARIAHRLVGRATCCRSGFRADLFFTRVEGGKAPPLRDGRVLLSLFSVC
jgi:hypothetical protein